MTPQRIRVLDGLHAHPGRTGTLTEPAPNGGFVVFDTPLTPGTLPACSWVPAEHMEVIA